MSTADDRDELAKVLGAHESAQLRKAGGWAGDTACSCGWRMAMWSHKDFPDVHRAHVAEQIANTLAARDARVAAEAWGEGYLRGTLDTTSDLEPADNPYRDEQETP
jgi:hypothetical protein